MGCLGYISITCLPAEEGKARGIAMGRHPSGRWNSEVHEVTPGFGHNCLPITWWQKKLVSSLAELFTEPCTEEGWEPYSTYKQAVCTRGCLPCTRGAWSNTSSLMSSCPALGCEDIKERLHTMLHKDKLKEPKVSLEKVSLREEAVVTLKYWKVWDWHNK